METQNKFDIKTRYAVVGLLRAMTETCIHFRQKPTYIYTDPDTYDIIRKAANCSDIYTVLSIKKGLIFLLDTIIVIPKEPEDLPETSPVMYATGKANEVYVTLTQLTDGRWTVEYINETYKQK